MRDDEPPGPMTVRDWVILVATLIGGIVAYQVLGAVFEDESEPAPARPKPVTSYDDDPLLDDLWVDEPDLPDSIYSDDPPSFGAD